MGKNFSNGLLYGISYFTTLPIKLKKFEADHSFYNGVVYSLPISGLLLAVITCLLFLILPFPAIYKAIFAAIIYLFLYGFIHLEAVADTIDGYFASLSGKDIHSIMKEPYIGSLGAIGTFCIVLLKVLAIAYLLYSEMYMFILLAFILSRSTIFSSLKLEFHQDSKFIESLQNGYKTNIFLKTVLLPLNLFTKIHLSLIKKKLGFLNGDTLGFHIEITELLLLNIGILYC
jgi:adenosylcobinamide-GDP ribazoletransferase